MPDPDRTLVVGGGVGGLVLALELARAGRPVTVLEASGRLGGQVAAHEVDGLRLDAGAESFATRGGVVAALLARLGLSDRARSPVAGGAWLARAARRGAAVEAVALPATSVLGIPARPLSPDVVRAIGLPGAVRAAADALLPRGVGAGAADLAALVRARMGGAVLDGLVAPVTEGVHSRSPAALPVSALGPAAVDALRAGTPLARAVRAARASAPAGSLVAGLDGGMSTLVDALADGIRAAGGVVRTGARADGIAPDRVVLADGEALTGRVVVAAPGLVAPDRPERVALVTLVLDAPALASAPRGSGVIVAAGTAVAARAATHVTAKWAWARAAAGSREVLRLSYRDTVLAGRARTDADAPAVALADATALFGVPLGRDRLRGASVVRWSRAARLSEVPAGVPLVGESASGTGLAAVVSHSQRIARTLMGGGRAPGIGGDG